MKPNRSVGEDRAPRLVEADDPERALWRKLDWFATPPWATRAGAEIVKIMDPYATTVWEPACGDGIMARVLTEYFNIVQASDIHDFGCGALIGDFLNENSFPADRFETPDWVITNPPFHSAQEFIKPGLRVARRGVAVLCRLAFLEGAERFDTHTGNYPLKILAPFCERVPMQLGPYNPDGSTMTAYAWFIYTKEGIRICTTRFIAPGTRTRLTRKDDVRRFCKEKSGTLL